MNARPDSFGALAELSGSRQPTYVDHFVFTILGADHHTEDWTFQLPDSNSLHEHFDLKRVVKKS